MYLVRECHLLRDEPQQHPPDIPSPLVHPLYLLESHSGQQRTRGMNVLHERSLLAIGEGKTRGYGGVNQCRPVEAADVGV